MDFENNFEELAKQISETMREKPEEFKFISIEKIEHNSGIFYNPENECVGYSSEGMSGNRIISMSESDIDLVHDAYIFWQNWYDEKKHKNLVDIFKNYGIASNTEN